jgi:hypothetical protein
MAVETGSAGGVSENTQRVCRADGSSRRRLRPLRGWASRNAEWGRRLAISVLAANLIGDSLNALLRHEAKTLIGLPIGGLMILYLVKQKRSET